MFLNLKGGYNYIGASGIHFEHKDSPHKIRVTTDRKEAIEGNILNNKNATVFFYVSDQVLPEMIKWFDSSKIMKCMNEINQWQLFNNLSPSQKSWAIRLARMFVALDSVPFNQYVFATKVLCSGIMTGQS